MLIVRMIEMHYGVYFSLFALLVEMPLKSVS